MSASPVMVEQVIGEVVEEVGQLRAEVPRVDHVNCFLELGVGLIVVTGNIATIPVPSSTVG